MVSSGLQKLSKKEIENAVNVKSEKLEEKNHWN
jgi:hypothetical protein